MLLITGASGFVGRALVQHLHVAGRPFRGAVQLWNMERGELDSYRRLRSAGHLGTPAWAGFSAWSLAKFARRLAIVAVRRAVR